MELLSQIEIDNIISGCFQLLVGRELLTRLIISDEEYLGIDPQWVVNSIITDPILAPKRYRKNVFDCDDYVIYLKSKTGLYAQNNKLSCPLAIGFLLTKIHAYNFCIDDNRTLHIINTQSKERKTSSDQNNFSTFLEIDESNPIQFIYI